MPVSWNISDKNLVTFTVSGQLGKTEFEQIQNEIASLIQKIGQINVLVLLEDFTGWEKAEGWEDTSLMEKVDSDINKIAIVGEEKWRDLATMFTLKDLRSAAVEYFSSATDESAKLWLEID